MNKPRLIILSDLFGTTDIDWMIEYRSMLSPFFEISEYDSKVLAKISATNKEEVHQEFIQGGIEIAVNELIRLEPNIAAIIGCTIGGTIAWRYGLKKSEVALYLISATRVRVEKSKPQGVIHLFYGEDEQHGPKTDWFKQHAIIPIFIPNESHECYKSSSTIRTVCSTLIEDLNA